MKQPAELPRLLAGLIVSTAIAFWSWSSFEWLYPFVLLTFVFGFAAIISAFELVVSLPLLIWRLFQHRWVMRRSTRSGSAGWADAKELKKAGLFKRKRQRYFLGLHADKPLWVELKSSGLVLSPAGGGKTIAFVIPNPTSMIVLDLKATLAPMTFKLRQKKHRHRTVFINPNGKHEDIIGPADCYNLLQSIIDDWEDPRYHTQVTSKAKALAFQLLPEPQAEGENRYFRSGSRKFLVFAFLYVVVIDGPATLASAMKLLSDAKTLSDTIDEAAYSDALTGDLALIAKDLQTKYKKGDSKQTESFREGAVQVLEVYSPGGQLAQSTSKTTFRFRDMRKKRMTIYLMGDPTQAEVFEPWAAALMWNAINELIRDHQGKPVCLLCDEITNLKINRLPKLLTLLREFNVVFWLVVQSLQEWDMTYGIGSSETLLSQTEVKLLMGVQDHKTCQLIESMLGEETVKSISYNKGQGILGPISKSISEGPRKLKTADEVRRMPEGIVLVGKLKPIMVKILGYQQISPWKRWVGINPLKRKKFRAWTRLKL